ncbi:MAG: alpha/beta hydrolase [Proteobacteria bacterium]|nr:alpha/beta hydrolase [Pseudomonadota bacterium]
MKVISIVLSSLLFVTACELADPGEAGNLVPRTVTEDSSLPALDLAGTRLHVETFGSPSNPALIFLHGGPGGDYRSLLRLRGQPGEPRLEDDYFLVFWDQRGTGLSQRHDAADINIDVYLSDLDAIIAKFSPDRPPALIGHSWGGMYATAYLNQYPERVAAAVLLEPGPLTGALYSELKSEIIHLDFWSEWLSDLLWDQRFLSPDDHARMDYAPLVARKNVQPGYHLSQTDPAPLWRLGAVAQTAILASGAKDGVWAWNFVTNTRSFSRPVNLVASSDNEVLGLAFQTRQAEFFDHPTISVVTDAGHDFPWTAPDQTIALIRQTLDQAGYGVGASR